MNRKLVFLLVAIAVAAELYFAFGGCCQKTSVLKVEKIVVGLDDNFPPIGFKDDKGKIVGHY